MKVSPPNCYNDYDEEDNSGFSGSKNTLGVVALSQSDYLLSKEKINGFFKEESIMGNSQNKGRRTINKEKALKVKMSGPNHRNLMLDGEHPVEYVIRNKLDRISTVGITGKLLKHNHRQVYRLSMLKRNRKIRNKHHRGGEYSLRNEPLHNTCFNYQDCCQKLDALLGVKNFESSEAKNHFDKVSLDIYKKFEDFMVNNREELDVLDQQGGQDLLKKKDPALYKKLGRYSLKVTACMEDPRLGAALDYIMAKNLGITSAREVPESVFNWRKIVFTGCVGIGDDRPRRVRLRPQYT